MSSNKTPQSTPFWFGGAASCVAALVSHPFDLAKVRLQTFEGTTKPGMLRTMVLIIKNEGPLALYNGLSASVLRQGTYSTVRFGAYEKLKENFTANGRKPGFLELLFCSTTAGAVGGAFGNPADVINVRMQNDGQLAPELRRHYKHAFDGLIRIAKEEGVKSLARGIGPNMGRAVLMTASQLTSYDVFKELLITKAHMRSEGVLTHFSSSLLAGLVATTICSPVDVIKTRIMNASKSASSLQVFADTLKHEGISAFFRGWTPAFIRLGPHTIVTFMVLEQFKTWYRKAHPQT